MDFKELGLSALILKALEAQGYKTPTPIQSGAIPPALAGRDVLGLAQTGTGKTCAFATPILQRLAQGAQPRPRVIRSLVLTPTRELALQIQESFEHYGANLPLRSAVIFGGVGQGPQVEKLKQGVDILVATPGRLLDLQGQGLLDLRHIQIFVLDEADRMLDMGFIHDVRRVLRLLPERKQTLFFSATMPPEVMGLVKELLHDYARVEVTPVSTPVEVIQQSLYFVDKANKTKLLAWLVDRPEVKNALVFSRTKHGANKVAGDLLKAGIPAAAIHGNKSQTARVQALGDFKAGRVQVLVATDIAARGLDIEELSHVFNYNMPDVPETYVHRIGRTGRAGRGGTAISFCDANERDELKAVEKLLGKPIPVVEGHPWPMVDFSPPQRDKHGKVVNADDQEARQAARERKRQREEAAKSAGAPSPKKDATAPSRKGTGAPSKQDATALRLNPKQSPQPARRPQTPGEKRQAAGYKASRTVDEAVRAMQPRTPSPAPAADKDEAFARWMEEERRIQAQKGYNDPLAGDTVMDATARLLAPRTPVRAAPTAKKATPQPTAKKPAPQPSRQPHAVKKAEAAAPTKKPAVSGPAPKPVKSAAPRPAPAAPKARPQDSLETRKAQIRAAAKARRETPRREPERPRSSGELDSTEHQSLMKPYYLNED